MSRMENNDDPHGESWGGTVGNRTDENNGWDEEFEFPGIEYETNSIAMDNETNGCDRDAILYLRRDEGDRHAKD